MLIVFEGIDGCGKGAQIDLLKEKTGAASFKYPTSKYSMLREHLDKKITIDPKALFLLFLADISDDQENIKDALEENEIVILDRYVFSTLAYEVDGLNMEKGKKIVSNMEYLKPDIVFLLDVDPETAQARKSAQKTLDRYEENLKYLGNVRANYLSLYQESFLSDNWYNVDATQSIEVIRAEIMKALR